MTRISARPGPNSSVISSRIDAEQVMSESDSCTSQDSTRVHLPADRARHPAGVPAGLGGVDGGNQWDIEEFGQRDSRVGHQPVVRVHDIGAPRLDRLPGVFMASPARVIECPIASVQAIMSVPKSNSCGSWAAATTRTPSLTSSVRRMGARVGAGRAPAEHHDLVSGGGQRGGQSGGRGVPSPPTTTGGYSHDTIRIFIASYAGVTP